jgi:hypothetical protein
VERIAPIRHRAQKRREQWQHTRRRFRDGFPECPQHIDAPLRRIAGDQRGIDRADGNAGNAVRMEIGLGQRLIDAGLVGAQGAAALKQQRNAPEWWPFPDGIYPVFRHDRLSGGCERQTPMTGGTIAGR